MAASWKPSEVVKHPTGRCDEQRLNGDGAHYLSTREWTDKNYSQYMLSG